MCIIIFLRPFKLAKDNLLEIVNEVFFSSMIFMLCIYNDRSKWSNTSETAYLMLIMSNSGIIMLILFMSFVYNMVEKC